MGAQICIAWAPFSDCVADGGSPMFDDVNTRSILDQVPPKLQGDEARSLWRRIQSEFRSGGVGAVESYLRSQSDDIARRLRTELSASKDAE